MKVYIGAFSIGMGPVPWVVMSEVNWKPNCICSGCIYNRWTNIKVCWRFTIAQIDCLQIFSINMKAIGGSLVTLVSWLGSFAISYSFSFLMDWSSAGNAPGVLLFTYNFRLHFYLFGKKQCLMKPKVNFQFEQKGNECVPPFVF